MRWLFLFLVLLVFVGAATWQNEYGSGPYTDNIIPTGYWLVKHVDFPSAAVLNEISLYGFDRGVNGDVVSVFVWADDQGKPGTLLASASKAVSVTGQAHWESVPVSAPANGPVWVGVRMQQSVGFLWFDAIDSGTDFFWEGNNALTRLGRTYSVRVQYDEFAFLLPPPEPSPTATPLPRESPTLSPTPKPKPVMATETWQNENASYIYTDNIIPTGYWLAKKMDLGASVQLLEVELVGFDRGVDGDVLDVSVWADQDGKPGALLAHATSTAAVNGVPHTEYAALPNVSVSGTAWVGLKMRQSVGFLSFDQADLSTDFFFDGSALTRLGRTYSVRLKYAPAVENAPADPVFLEPVPLRVQALEGYTRATYTPNVGYVNRGSGYRTGPQGESHAYWFYPLAAQQKFFWETQAVPTDFTNGTVTFAFYAGVGVPAGYSAPFRLTLNGHTLLEGFPAISSNLVQGDESRVYLQNKWWDSNVYSEGVVWVTVPASWLEPGKPASFGLESLGGASNTAFYLYDFPDSLAFEYNLVADGSFPLAELGNNFGVPLAVVPPEGLGLSSLTNSQLVSHYASGLFVGASTASSSPSPTPTASPTPVPVDSKLFLPVETSSDRFNFLCVHEVCQICMGQNCSELMPVSQTADFLAKLETPRIGMTFQPVSVIPDIPTSCQADLGTTCASGIPLPESLDVIRTTAWRFKYGEPVTHLLRPVTPILAYRYVEYSDGNKQEQSYVWRFCPYPTSYEVYYPQACWKSPEGIWHCREETYTTGQTVFPHCTINEAGTDAKVSSEIFGVFGLGTHRAWISANGTEILQNSAEQLYDAAFLLSGLATFSWSVPLADLLLDEVKTQVIQEVSRPLLFESTDQQVCTVRPDGQMACQGDPSSETQIIIPVD
ncbi:hypothetical protein HY572_02335 [Candidatus Micrarchaeota archaeon]|nr:hypothetical protein [Candidatus Micrarchaeota archaeon]